MFGIMLVAIVELRHHDVKSVEHIEIGSGIRSAVVSAAVVCRRFTWQMPVLSA